jgi:phosphopantothenoylcysteine decarboxylase/phosphopantothenate--cysteine ligase
VPVPPSPETPRFTGKRLVLGVTGSIAAYKAVGLLRALLKEGASVDVVMTDAAKRFVAPLTFEVLSGRPVASDLFEAHHEMLHLALPDSADVIVIAPATANSLAKAALGLADDLLSTMLLTTRCPIVVAPAMDGDMWTHPTVADHVATLKRRGVIVVEPEEGPLASGKLGQGRLAEEAAILAAIDTLLAPQRDFAGLRVLVSAGPTQEPIDPVRFISNRSSGKMGYALAAAARERGGQVVLVSGPTQLDPPAGVIVVPVSTAEKMEKALLTHFGWAQIVIMAAAVADFRPRHPSAQKLKNRQQGCTSLDVEQTEDILASFAKRRSTQILVGFAAETERLETHAREKLRSKDIDLIVANDVTVEGAGFGSDRNAALVLSRSGDNVSLPLMPKRELADRILDCIQTYRQSTPSPRRS